MSAITNDSQALVAGAIMGFLATEAAKYRDGSGHFAITDVYPDVDDDGNYLSTINVRLKSGTLLSVNVAEIAEIQEQL